MGGERAEKLTGGEVVALVKLVRTNGINGPLWRPEGVRLDTVRNLYRKGYLTGSWDATSIERHGQPRIVGSE
jgi:hypothetical protein